MLFSFVSAVLRNTKTAIVSLHKARRGAKMGAGIRLWMWGMIPVPPC